MKYRHRTRSYAGQYRAGIRRYCPCTHSYSVSISNIIPAEDSVHMHTIVTLKFDLLHITRALLAAHPVTNLRGWFVFLRTARKSRYSTASYFPLVRVHHLLRLVLASMQAIPALIRALVPTFAVNHTSLGHDLNVPLHSTEVISSEPRRKVTVSKKKSIMPSQRYSSNHRQCDVTTSNYHKNQLHSRTLVKYATSIQLRLHKQ